MNKETSKKIIASFVIMGFILMSTIPAINARIAKEDVKNILDTVKQICGSFGDNGDNNSTNVYDLLIIAPNRFILPLKLLESHKNNVGVKTRLVSLDEVYDRMYWKGRDAQEKHARLVR